MKGKDLKLLICGGRRFTAYELLESVVDRILETMEYESIEIVSGHARGADSLGEEYAKKHNIPVAVFKAEWKKYGRPAGPIRNARMVEYISNYDMPVVVAFKSPNSKGTMHTVGLAKSKNIKVFEVDYKIASMNNAFLDFSKKDIDYIELNLLTSIIGTKCVQLKFCEVSTLNFSNMTQEYRDKVKKLYGYIHMLDEYFDRNMICFVAGCINHLEEQKIIETEYECIFSKINTSSFTEEVVKQCHIKFPEITWLYANDEGYDNRFDCFAFHTEYKNIIRQAKRILIILDGFCQDTSLSSQLKFLEKLGFRGEVEAIKILGQYDVAD